MMFPGWYLSVQQSFNFELGEEILKNIAPRMVHWKPSEQDVLRQEKNKKSSFHHHVKNRERRGSEETGRGAIYLVGKFC